MVAIMVCPAIPPLKTISITDNSDFVAVFSRTCAAKAVVSI